MYEPFYIFEIFAEFLAPGKDGTWWNLVGMDKGLYPGAPGAMLYYFNNPLFNQLQRLSARLLYKTNGFAKSGVENLVNMVGVGKFQYVAENEATQKRLDKWIEENDWHNRSREGAIKLFVDGECFYRFFDDKVRFIDPNSVFDTGNNAGIITQEDDYETVLEYVINFPNKGDRISASEVQHRKLGWSEDKRGTSLLFPVFGHLSDTDKFLYGFTRSLIAQVKVAWWRKHNSPKEAVEIFKANIQQQRINQPNNLFNTNCENTEQYADGSVVDLPQDVEVDYPTDLLDSDKIVSCIRANLRAVAAAVCLPENVLSQDQDSIAAYNGQMVADSHIVKGLESWQERFINWDKKLLTQCGFDVDKINITPPPCAVSDKAADVQVAEFLTQQKLASKETLAAMFGVDYQDEIEIMKGEEETDNNDQLNDNKEDNEELNNNDE